jgi:hypothetical protein
MLEWLMQLSPEERARAIDQAWGNFASTPDGRVVIATLLDELGFLDPVKGEEGIVRHNIAVMVIRRIGRDSIERVVEALVGKDKTNE